MILINGVEADPKKLAAQYPPNSVEAKVIELMGTSQHEYRYDSEGELKFELGLRKAIVNAARDLDRSGMQFKTFRNSRANPDFWEITSEGGFQLAASAKPSDAIRDIFENGSKYGTECSTAMVIVYYKALLDVLPEELFNKLFSGMYLMDWQHLDPDLGIVTYDKPADALPGDGRYFDNPDSDPLKPEWQGENVFDLGHGLYFGHGLGIADADKIVESLNSLRKENAEKSAFLMDMAERPDFKGLYKKYTAYMAAGGAAHASFTDSFWAEWNKSVI